MSELVLGRLVRYADASEATVWVETDVACGVEVFVDDASHRSHTLRVKGHTYALAHVSELQTGRA